MRRIGMSVLGLLSWHLHSLASGPPFGSARPRAFGADFVVAEPLGEFSRNGDVAAGLSIFGVTNGGALALRVEGAWMAYDVSYQGYGVSTTSQIGTLGAGPQLTLGKGALRFYGFATMAIPVLEQCQLQQLRLLRQRLARRSHDLDAVRGGGVLLGITAVTHPSRSTLGLAVCGTIA